MDNQNTHPTEKTILFGIKDQQQDTLLNTLYLYTKQYIWNTRFKEGTKPNIVALKHKLLKDIENIKYIQGIKNQDNKFNEDWNNILIILRTT